MVDIERRLGPWGAFHFELRKKCDAEGCHSPATERCSAHGVHLCAAHLATHRAMFHEVRRERLPALARA